MKLDVFRSRWRSCISALSMLRLFPAAHVQLLLASHMENLEGVKGFLQSQKAADVSWHTVLNNTTTTRPKSRGGPVVSALTKLKHFDMIPAGTEGFVTPMHRCVLLLPHSFTAFDDKKVEAIGYGQNAKEASEAACCDALVKLLCAEPYNVVLHRTHWNLPTNALQDEVNRLTNEHQPLVAPPPRELGEATIHTEHIVEHQPLVVPPSRPLEEASRLSLVGQVVRRCLETHDGKFDPARISSRRYDAQSNEAAPWKVLETALKKGELRGFIEEHPDFQWIPNGPKGMLITWATRREPAAGADHKDQALSNPASSNQLAGPIVRRLRTDHHPHARSASRPARSGAVSNQLAPASCEMLESEGEDQALLVLETSSTSWPALTSELVDAGWRSFLYGDDDRIYHPETGGACFMREGKCVSVPALKAGLPPLMRPHWGADDSNRDEPAENGVGTSSLQALD